jgi:hypothetical protein
MLYKAASLKVTIKGSNGGRAGGGRLDRSCFRSRTMSVHFSSPGLLWGIQLILAYSSQASNVPPLACTVFYRFVCHFLFSLSSFPSLFSPFSASHFLLDDIGWDMSLICKHRIFDVLCRTRAGPSLKRRRWRSCPAPRLPLM